MHKTYQTKLFKVTGYPTNNLAEAYLNDWSEYFQSIERKLYVDIVYRKPPLSDLKKRYIKEYGINARQLNSIRVQLQGKISSVKELKKSELDKKKLTISVLEEKLVLLIEERNDLKHSMEITNLSDENFPTLVKRYRATKAKIHHTKRRMQKLKNDISRITADMERDIARICFGSKALFRKQHNLEQNGFRSHIEWKSKWHDARSNQSMCLGSSDETFGNQNCQYGKSNTLVIRVAVRFRDIYGDHIRIPNVRFKYGQENIDRCKETYEGCTKGGKPQKYYKGAMTHRFFRNEFGWYLYTSVEVEDAPRITDSRVGAIGVDFNVNFAQLGFVDRFGNPIDEVKIKYSMYGKTAEQIDAMIGDMSKDICEFGRYYRIPVYIENLCLEGAKKFIDKGARYNRMINSFPYRKFRDAVESRGKKTGIEVRTVNPSYTSLIGQFNFMKKYGLSSHGAAACVIARRGLNLETEKMSAKHKGFLRHSKDNINLNRNNRKLWMLLHSVIKKRYKFNDRIRLLYNGVL